MVKRKRTQPSDVFTPRKKRPTTSPPEIDVFAQKEDINPVQSYDPLVLFVDCATYMSYRWHYVNGEDFLMRKTCYWWRHDLIEQMMSQLEKTTCVQIFHLDVEHFYKHWEDFKSFAPSISLCLWMDPETRGLPPLDDAYTEKTLKRVQQLEFHSVRIRCPKYLVIPICRMLPKIHRTTQVMIQIHSKKMLKDIEGEVAYELLKDGLRENLYLERFEFGNYKTEKYAWKWKSYMNEACQNYIDRNISISGWVGAYGLKTREELGKVLEFTLRQSFANSGLYLPQALGEFLISWTYAL